MSLSYEERKAVVEFRIEKAIRAYEQAKGVIPLMYWETIANRLYYAAYNAVSALLISNGDNAQTHAGVTHLFGMRFVNTGICSKDRNYKPRHFVYDKAVIHTFKNSKQSPRCVMYRGLSIALQ